MLQLPTPPANRFCRSTGNSGSNVPNLTPGETYEHDEHGSVRFTAILQRCGETDIETVDGEFRVAATDVQGTRVEFQFTDGRACFGPGTEPLDEFLENIDFDA